MREITEKLLLIGNPVAHSVSPGLHNFIFSRLRASHAYGLLRLESNEIEEFVQSFRNSNGIGFNVTIPHKVDIMQYLDDLTDDARAIGAVNTVKLENGRLIGHNTDGSGFLRALQSAGIDPRGASIKLLGAGGGARAVAYSLAQAGAQKITIYNRNEDRARELCNSIGQPLHTAPLADFTPRDCDILINTTPVGMSPNIDQSPALLDGLLPSTFAVDIIYNPRETQFLKEAKSHGASTQNGLRMLIFQALLAQEFWFGTQISHDQTLVALLESHLG